MKEEMSPHTRKPLQWRRQGMVVGGSFGATEESTARGIQRAKRRDSHREDPCQPALTSLRGLSAHPPAWMGGGWEFRFWLLQRSDPRERTGVGCMNTA